MVKFNYIYFSLKAVGYFHTIPLSGTRYTTLFTMSGDFPADLINMIGAFLELAQLSMQNTAEYIM